MLHAWFCMSAMCGDILCQSEFSGPNQFVTFLKGNGGPGVQHVAYHSRDVFSTATLIRDHGQAFLRPPIEYYSQVHLQACTVHVHPPAVCVE